MFLFNLKTWLFFPKEELMKSLKGSMYSTNWGIGLHLDLLLEVYLLSANVALQNILFSLLALWNWCLCNRFTQIASFTTEF